MLTFGADPRGGQGMGAGMLHLEWAEVLANRPVTAVSFSPGATDSLLLVAYGPVGAQLGTAELIKASGCLHFSVTPHIITIVIQQ